MIGFVTWVETHKDFCIAIGALLVIDEFGFSCGVFYSKKDAITCLVRCERRWDDDWRIVKYQRMEE